MNSDAKDQEPSKKEERYHRYHTSHDNREVHLISRDGVRFVADAGRLAGASVVFRDMLNVTDSESGTENDASRIHDNGAPIETDLPSDILDVFLNSISVSTPCVHLNDFERVQKLLTFCEKFDCEKNLLDCVRQRLFATAKGREWDLLIYASERDDRPMGAQALSQMTRDTFTCESYFWARVKKLSIEWQADLLQLCLERPRTISINRTVVYCRKLVTETKDEPVLPFVEETSWSRVSFKFKMSNEDRAVSRSLTLKAVGDLLELCEKFDCNTLIINAITSKIHDIIPGRQWAVLILAGKRKDLKLSTYALEHMDSTHFVRSFKQVVSGEDMLIRTDMWDRMEMLPMTLQVLLWRLCWEDPIYGSGVPQMSTSANWAKVAADFNARLPDERVLCASDGTVFMTDSWRLVQGSTGFANMFEMAQPLFADKKRSRNELSVPIVLDAPADLVNIFVNMFNVSLPDAPAFTLQKVIALWELCEKFECSRRLIDAVRNQMKELIPGREWTVLIYAGKRKEVWLGAEVLKNMNADRFIGDFSQSHLAEEDPRTGEPIEVDFDLKNTDYRQRMRMLPLTWRALLYDICWPEASSQYNREKDRKVACLQLREDWLTVADLFERN
ncbi:hypothetical protein CI109_106935 [Kwoniella shandongensis]|uniref:Uncharacterized protein n=1 Tax=Kwoniella shandongensis TaxID=1734106 RepID=A0A5M6C715_9TREE|nr:uncharacterized protein CI109_000811 [Kwoniella shandongensis]KAA5530631.1 hypothetical protein CI109_000811 [Kwoniella shandongensis]